MFKFVMRKFNDAFVLPYRHNKLIDILMPFLNDVGTVLDVGPKDGKLAYDLMEKSECQMTGLDVHLQPYTYIDVHHYDGGTFPFSDNAFDCVMMIDMLHHTENIEQILSEAKRVARRFVIIKDHYWQTRFNLLSLYLGDYLANMPYGVPMTYNYLRLAEWGRLFEQLQLAKVECSTFKYTFLEPAAHIVVKLHMKTPEKAVHDKAGEVKSVSATDAPAQPDADLPIRQSHHQSVVHSQHPGLQSQRPHAGYRQ
jgi:SAM-dependent methyltransferase